MATADYLGLLWALPGRQAKGAELLSCEMQGTREGSTVRLEAG